MDYRQIVTNIVSDAKLLTKMTARQASILRRKIYTRIDEATNTEECHKENHYPNKKRKIIDKDNNIGSLLIMYKGLIERYNTFTVKAKTVQKKNFELEVALHDTKEKLYYKTRAVMVYQFILFVILLGFLWMDIATFITFRCKYKEYKKLCIEVVVLWFTYLVESYVCPSFNSVSDWFTSLVF